MIQGEHWVPHQEHSFQAHPQDNRMSHGWLASFCGVWLCGARPTLLPSSAMGAEWTHLRGCKPNAWEEACSLWLCKTTHKENFKGRLRGFSNRPSALCYSCIPLFFSVKFSNDLFSVDTHKFYENRVVFPLILNIRNLSIHELWHLPRNPVINLHIYWGVIILKSLLWTN